MASVEMNLLHCLERLPCEEALLYSPQQQRHDAFVPTSRMVVGAKRKAEGQASGLPCLCRDCQQPPKRVACSPVAASPLQQRLQLPQFRVAPQSPSRRANAIPPVNISRPALPSAVPLPALQRLPVRPPPPPPRPSFNSVPPPVLSAKACALSKHSCAPQVVAAAAAAAAAAQSNGNVMTVPQYPSSLSAKASSAAPVDHAQRLNAAMQALQGTPLGRLLASTPRIPVSVTNNESDGNGRAGYATSQTNMHAQALPFPPPQQQSGQRVAAAVPSNFVAAPSPLSLPRQQGHVSILQNAPRCVNGSCSCCSGNSSGSSGGHMAPTTPSPCTPTPPNNNNAPNNHLCWSQQNQQQTTQSGLLPSLHPSPESNNSPWTAVGAPSAAVDIDINAQPSLHVPLETGKADATAAADLLLLCEGECISENDGDNDNNNNNSNNKQKDGEKNAHAAASSANPNMHSTKTHANNGVSNACDPAPAGTATHGPAAGLKHEDLLCDEERAAGGDDQLSYSASFSLEWSSPEASSASSSGSCCSSGNSGGGATSCPSVAPTCKASLQGGSGGKEEGASDLEGESSYVTRTSGRHSGRQRHESSEFEDEMDEEEEDYEDEFFDDFDCTSKSK